MAYLALYRKFRPKGFDGLVGQEHIVKTLVNQIETDKIGHAYLFCGARGTGKTSAAKIFARAINCLHPVDGSPCGECEVCRGLSSSNQLDILEIDAASNNRVEEIRELRENVVYPPTVGKYKVYIVDEVHMLTDSAFNALLKTLEEPPKHAVFILATTEVHKLPATILSRCMRFDFRLIPTERIASHVASIYDAEGKEYEKEAVTAIARAGEGSIRDALSVADICMSYGTGKLTYEDVLTVLGASDRSRIEQTVGYILSGETGKLLASIDDLAALGKGMAVLCRDVTALLRELLVVKTCADATAILGLPEDRMARMNELAGITNDARVLRALDIFARTEGDLRFSTNPRVVFEAAAVRAAMPKQDYDITALLGRIKALEEAVAKGVTVVPATIKMEDISTTTTLKQCEKSVAVESPVPIIENPKAVKEEPSVEEIPLPEPPPEEETIVIGVEQKQDFMRELGGRTAPLTSTPTGAKIAADKLFGAFVRTLRRKNYIMLWAVCQELKGRVEGDTLIVKANSENDYVVLTRAENEKMIRDVLAELGGYSFVVEKAQVKASDAFEEDVAAMSRAFGEKVVKIKE